MYWLVLFTVTMKKQILHMIKHRYVPFSWGKKVGGRTAGLVTRMDRRLSVGNGRVVRG